MTITGFTDGTCQCSVFNIVSGIGEWVFGSSQLAGGGSGTDPDYDACFPRSSGLNQPCSGCRWYLPHQPISGTKFWDALLYYDYITDAVILNLRIWNSAASNCTKIIYNCPRTSFDCTGQTAMTFNFVSQSGGTCGTVPGTIAVWMFGAPYCCQNDSLQSGDCSFCSALGSNYPKSWLANFSGFTGAGCSLMNGGFTLGTMGDASINVGGGPFVVCAAEASYSPSGTFTATSILYDSSAIDGTWKLWIHITGTNSGIIIYSMPSGSFNCAGDNVLSLVSNTVTNCTAVPATVTLHPSADIEFWKYPCCPRGSTIPTTLHATIKDLGGCSCIDHTGTGIIVPLTYRPATMNPVPCKFSWYGQYTSTCSPTVLAVTLICSCPFNDINADDGPYSWTLYLVCYNGSGGVQCPGISSFAQAFADAYSCSVSGAFQAIFNKVQMTQFGGGGPAICCGNVNAAVNVVVGL